MKQIRVMIVDDVEINRELLERVFEGVSEVVSLNTGEAALALMDSFMPDVILLDVMMPGISGYDVCRHIRANDHLKAMKVIMLSARAMHEDHEKGMESGADEYISKPFNAFALRDRILRMFGVNA